MRELTVNVAGLIFSGWRGPLAIGPGGFDGWDDGVEMRVRDEPLPNAHGSRNTPVYGGSRIVNISGYTLAQSPGELNMLRSRVTGLLADGSLGRIAVQDEGEVTWADCRLAAQTRFTKRSDGITGDYQLQLWCPDGRKFGETRKFVASVGSNTPAYHMGNYPATPQVKVEGSMPDGYILTLKGQAFTVTHPLVSGQPHDINYEDGRLRINGAIIHGGLGYGFTPLVTPGVPTALAIEPLTTGTATATLTLIDTYI